MKKRFLLPSIMLSIVGGLLVGCSSNTNAPSVEKKTAYASSSAIGLISNSANSTKSKKMLGISSSEVSSLFNDLLSQFDVLLSASESTNVRVIENSEGEFKYTNEITIGEDSQFTYYLNYNQTEESGIISECGELIINYEPLDFNYSLDFENVITYDNEKKSGSVDFKLYIDLINKDNKNTYVQVSEKIDVNTAFNKFNYSLVINDNKLMNYEIEIPVEGQSLNVYINDMKFSITRDVSDSSSSIVIAYYLADIEVFSIVYIKDIDDNGDVSYSLQTSIAN